MFGMSLVDGRLRYWFYAIQSVWHESSRVIAACPLQPLADQITYWVDFGIKMMEEKENRESTE